MLLLCSDNKLYYSVKEGSGAYALLKTKEGGWVMADQVQSAVNPANSVATGIPVSVNANVITKVPGTDSGQAKAQDLLLMGGASGKNGNGKVPDIGKIVESLNQFLEVNQSEVRFSLFKDPNTIVVRLIEQASGKTIREIPSVKMLQIAHSFMQMMGVLIDEKV